MTCRDIEPLLSLHLDGACSAEEEARVRSHVASCAGCTELLGELRNTVGLVSALPEMRTGPSFEAQLSQRLRAVAASGWREPLSAQVREWLRTSQARWPAVAVGTAVILAIGLNYCGVLPHGGEGSAPAVVREAAAARSADDYLAAAVEVHRAYESAAQPLAMDGLLLAAENGKH